MTLFFIFVWILLLYLAGILLFTAGFLLKRIVISQNSSCVNDDLHPGFKKSLAHDIANGCWTDRRFRKAVIIIIDALRFDFVVRQDSVNKTEELPFQNKFSSIYEKLENSPENCFLYKFVADPPTTTLQRLKGMTTGSLPTFVDAGSNFAKTEITEDNFIDQLYQLGKNITFMGDDTWTGLFPQRFNKNFPYSSFNVKDLDTVDNGVIGHLLPELKETNWDLIIAHLLGVDHCGHTFGPYHSKMTEKLTQMDNLLRTVMTDLPDDTILFVLGDHGMTKTGDHGGDSPDELNAALFIYSKSKTFTPHTSMAYETITQVDLVPTISLLLGAPIPFSNLGTVITDLFKTCTDCKRPLIQAHYNTARVLHLNAVQVHQYITAYAQLSGVLSADKLNEYDNLFQTCEAEYEALLSLIQTNHDANVLIGRLENLSNQYKQYLSDIRSMCHSVWAQFDIPRMLLGIGLCLTASILTFVFLWEGNFSSISMAAIGFSVFIFVSVGLVIFEFTISFILFVLGLLLLFFCILFVKFIKFDKRIRNSLSELNLFNVFSLFLWIFYISSMFSNSFLVYEGDVTGFFSESLFVMQFLKVFADLSKSSRKDQKPVKRTKHESGTIISPTMIVAGFTLFACFAVRMSRFFHVCREEQSNCSSINLAQSIPAFSSSSTMYTNCCFLISAFCIAILPYTAYRWLRYTGNLNGYSPAMLVASYGVSFTAFLVCIYWGMRGLSDKHTIPLRLATPRIIYALSLASIVALLFKPLCLYVVGKQPRDDSIPLNTISGDDLVPQIYNHLKMSWKKHLRSFQSTESTTPAEKEPVVVYGLASVYSASSIVLLTTVSMVIALLLGEHLVPSVLFLWLAMFVILELHACRVHSMTNFGCIPWSSIVIMSFLASEHFYATGHQPTIPSIRWEAAYHGFQGDFANNAIPATLITINTFASYIFCTVALPLLMYWPFTRGHYVRKAPEDQNKGEFALNEDTSLFRSLLNQLFMKYVFLLEMKMLAMMFCVFLHRRHLMVWKIFAPRFVYEGATFVVVSLISAFNYLFVLRVNRATNQFIDRISE